MSAIEMPFTMHLSSFSRIDVDYLECRGTISAEVGGLIQLAPCVMLLQRLPDGAMNVVSVTVNPDGDT